MSDIGQFRCPIRDISRVPTYPHVLLVDDDARSVVLLAAIVKQSAPQAHIISAANGEQAAKAALRHRPEAAIVDLCLEPTMGADSGLRLITRLLQNDATCRVVALTGHQALDLGVRAVERGAASFVRKPVQVRHLEVLLRDALEQCALRREIERLRAERAARCTFAGTSDASKRVRAEIEAAARHMLPLLIIGESGCGKSHAARCVHDAGSRAEGAWVVFHAHDGTSEMVQSELFGHRRGAFTGADADRTGLLRSADGGTVFLDDIDALPLGAQASLLGAVQLRRFRPLGSDVEILSDFRVISGSNADFAELIERREFRFDLFHRLAQCRIRIPPLRERIEDLAGFIERILIRLRGAAVAVEGLTSRSRDLVRAYHWPGNVRELDAVIEVAAYRAAGAGRAAIEPQDLDLPEGDSARRNAAMVEKTDFHTCVERYKRALISETLSRVGGNQSLASRILKIDRGTIRRLTNA